MSASTSRLAYADCYELMDRALDSKKGIRLRMLDEGAARNFRVRLHYARTIDRKDNHHEREDGDPLKGRSVYDQLQVRVVSQKKGVVLLIEKRSIDSLEIEEIEDEQQGPVNGDSGEVGGASQDQSGEGKIEESSLPEEVQVETFQRRIARRI